MNPTKHQIDSALAHLDPDSARSVARQAVKKHRAAKVSYLTQQAIDGDGRGEGRMAIVMAGTVRFHHRSWLARLFGWMR